MPAPRWLARFNLHVTNRILGPLARHVPGMGIVIHRGRRTHREHQTPVMFFRRNGDLIFALTYGRESQWVQNVLAEGNFDFETQGRTLHLLGAHLIHDARPSFIPAPHRIILGALNVSDFLEAEIEK